LQPWLALVSKSHEGGKLARITRKESRVAL
jgi:hypothetical protein